MLSLPTLAQYLLCGSLGIRVAPSVSPMSALRVGGMGLMWCQVQSVLVSLISREVSVLLGIMFVYTFTLEQAYALYTCR